jgi:hypothetical protein
VSDATSGTPHIRWSRGGEARVLTLASSEAITVRSTVPSPPGSRIEGRLEGDPPAMVRVKIHGSKRQPEGDFVLSGRLLDVTREVRARVEALAGPATGQGS